MRFFVMGMGYHRQNLHFRVDVRLKTVQIRKVSGDRRNVRTRPEKLPGRLRTRPGQQVILAAAQIPVEAVPAVAACCAIAAGLVAD